MIVPPFSAKLRLPVLALVLSCVLLFFYSRSAWQSSQSWDDSPVPQIDPSQPHSPASQPEIDLSKADTAVPQDGLLFDHTPEMGVATNSADTATPSTALSTSEPTPTSEVVVVKPRRRAIVTAIWDYSYASLALMLGHSIKQYNDLDALDADLILLTLEPDDDWLTGLTSWNTTVLEESGGWKIRTAPRLEVPGVNLTVIQAHRRLNLNKLRLFGWDEYERILFIDADCLVKGSIAELFNLPKEVEFAAAPDAWPGIEIDSGFNSGVMLFSPSQETFADMLAKLADKRYHNPKEGDQQFLQNYWKYRDWKLPLKFNLNLVHYDYRRATLWTQVWPDARIVHFTVQKPNEWWRGGWCVGPVTDPRRKKLGECMEFEVVAYYSEEFKKMRTKLGLEGQIGILH